MRIAPIDFLGTGQILPLFLSDVSGDDGHRIGGQAPQKIMPTSATSKYLCTLGLNETEFLSIYLNRDVDYYIQNDLHISGEGSAVQVIFHEKLSRRDDSQFQSGISGHQLRFGESQGDFDLESFHWQTTSSVNKVGGDAFILSRGRGGLGLDATLKREGYFQFFQLDLLALCEPGLIFSGDAPLGPAIFHLYLKRAATGYDWRCFWEI